MTQSNARLADELEPPSYTIMDRAALDVTKRLQPALWSAEETAELLWETLRHLDEQARYIPPAECGYAFGTQKCRNPLGHEGPCSWWPDLKVAPSVHDQLSASEARVQQLTGELGGVREQSLRNLESWRVEQAAFMKGLAESERTIAELREDNRILTSVSNAASAVVEVARAFVAAPPSDEASRCYSVLSQALSALDESSQREAVGKLAKAERRYWVIERMAPGAPAYWTNAIRFRGWTYDITEAQQCETEREAVAYLRGLPRNEPAKVSEHADVPPPESQRARAVLREREIGPWRTK